MKKINKPMIRQIFIDLHGMTVQGAFDHCRRLLTYHEMNGDKKVIVITGKSGQIRKEFPNWLDTWKYTGKVADHDGSFTVFLK